MNPTQSTALSSSRSSELEPASATSSGVKYLSTLPEPGCGNLSALSDEHRNGLGLGDMLLLPVVHLRTSNSAAAATTAVVSAPASQPESEYTKHQKDVPTVQTVWREATLDSCCHPDAGPLMQYRRLAEHQMFVEKLNERLSLPDEGGTRVSRGLRGVKRAIDRLSPSGGGTGANTTTNADADADAAYHEALDLQYAWYNAVLPVFQSVSVEPGAQVFLACSDRLASINGQDDPGFHTAIGTATGTAGSQARVPVQVKAQAQAQARDDSDDEDASDASDSDSGRTSPDDSIAGSVADLLIG